MTGQDIGGIAADLAAKFGLSRPAGRCFAAIWRKAAAPSAEGLVAELGLSRSNVSTALKELRSWGLVTVERAPGDRREYFAAPPDPWDVLRILLAERARRDLAPLADRLRALGAEAGAADLARVLEDVAGWMEGLSRLPAGDLARAVAGPPVEGGKKKKKKKAR